MNMNETIGHLASLFISPIESPNEDIEMMCVLIRLLLENNKKPAQWLEIAIRASSLKNIVRDGEDVEYLTAIQHLARMQTESNSERETHRSMALTSLMQIPEGQRNTELYSWLKQNLQ